jgi:predicted transcriptional regulator
MVLQYHHIRGDRPERLILGKKDENELPVLRVTDLVIDDEHVTVRTTSSLKEASKRMLSENVYIAVVLDDKQRVVGVIKSNEILDQVLQGVDISKVPVTKIMSRKFYKLRMDADLNKEANRIRREGYKFVVVVDDAGKYKGYFSMSDLRNAREILHRIGADRYEKK